MGDSLKGKVAIVMGAGAVSGPSDLQPIGNGRAAAMAYAGEGATVIAVDIEATMAQETKEMIENKGGSCSVIQADVSNAKDCQAIAEKSLKAHGRIDILHNNVGVGAKKLGGILDADEDDWDRVMSVNVKSIFHSCRAVLPQMIKQGNGAIINISSVGAVLHAYPELFIYTISKSAVNTFTRCLAYELADKGVRVNCIMPGMIDSPVIYKEILPLYNGDIDKMRKDRSSRIPMKKMGEPWDIAQASLFLASDRARYITGQILSVDGGLLLAAGVSVT